MKRPDRSMSFLSMSALDVVATATGIFVLLAVMLMPYYRMTQDANAEAEGAWAATAEVRVEIERLKAAARSAEAQRKAAAAQAEALARQAAESKKTGSTAGDRIAKLARQAEDDLRKAAELEDFARRKVIRELDLVFVVDTTSSMTRVIGELSEAMRGLVRIMERLVPSVRIGFVAYRDYDLGGSWVTRSLPLTSTASDLRRIESFAADLQRRIQGGRTVKEAVYAGMARAAQLGFRPSARQVIMLIGDAGPHVREERRTLSVVREFANRGPGRSVSTLFVPTLSYSMYGTNDREFFSALARTGRGTAHRHAGNMIETVVLSVLEN